MVVEDKYIGLVLAVVSTLGIGLDVESGLTPRRYAPSWDPHTESEADDMTSLGSSFVITKMGLNQAAEHHGFEGDGYTYFKSPLWWAGIIVMVIGEICNFSAYAFAPAILVTPLGALSVLIGYTKKLSFCS